MVGGVEFVCVASQGLNLGLDHKAKRAGFPRSEQPVNVREWGVNRVPQGRLGRANGAVTRYVAVSGATLLVRPKSANVGR